MTRGLIYPVPGQPARAQTIAVAAASPPRIEGSPAEDSQELAPARAAVDRAIPFAVGHERPDSFREKLLIPGEVVAFYVPATALAGPVSRIARIPHL